MTQEKMPTRTLMPCPFAGGEGAALATIGQTSGDAINFPQGFPSVYGAPASLGGKYVKRSEMNAIGNIATNDLFYKRCGGLNTFDAEFCKAVGGYPKGAVLDHVVNGLARRVMSLKDNNTVDFTQYGVDGNDSWRYCDVEPKPVDGIMIIDQDYEISSTGTTGSSSYSFLYEGYLNRNAKITTSGYVKSGTNVKFALRLFFGKEKSDGSIPTISEMNYITILNNGFGISSGSVVNPILFEKGNYIYIHFQTDMTGIASFHASVQLEYT